MALDVQKIHGYEPTFGMRVFTPAVMAMEDEQANARRDPTLLAKAVLMCVSMVPYAT